MAMFLIIGPVFSSQREYILEHGNDYVALRDVNSAKDPDKALKRRVLCDFGSLDAILAAVDKINAEQHIDGVLVTYESYVLFAAEIAAYLGLPGIPVEAAKACTDKFIMRSKFAECPEKISPDFAIADSTETVRAFAESHQFPIILKPANLSKSLLVTKNNDIDELLANYQRTAELIHGVYAKYAPHATPRIVVEEFMAGPVCSVDAFVDAAGVPHVLEQVVDYQIAAEAGFDDTFHYSRLLPSRKSPEEIAAIRHVAGLGCRALGMRSSPAHVEIIQTPEGPRIVEIGARNGGYRERMHDVANGIDILGNAQWLALGMQPEMTATRNDPIGVFELLPHEAGTYTRIEHEAELRALPSFSYLGIKAHEGTYIGKARDGYKMAAVVILHHTDPVQFNRDREFLATQVRVLTEPVMGTPDAPAPGSVPVPAV